MKELLSYVGENNLPLKFYGVTEEILERIKANPLFKNIMFNYERKWSDYVYSASEISTFKGKKFSGQRNHINKFRSLYGEPVFKPLLIKYRSAIKNCPYNVNDITTGSFFMWNSGVDVRFCMESGMFFSQQDICGEPSFSYPFANPSDFEAENPSKPPWKKLLKGL